MLVTIGMGCADTPQEVEEGRGMAGDAKVRPGDKVKLTYSLHLIGIDLGKEGGRERRREGAKDVTIKILIFH